MTDFPKPRPPGARAEILKNKSPGGILPSSIPISEGFFRSFDGTKIFYRSEGESKDGSPPLVFCYGLMCSSLHWTYQIDAFRQKQQTICMDYRAHQNSEIPKDVNSLNIETMATDLGLCLDELGIKDAVFLGHSMGGNVVMELYRQQPDRFRAMILANATARRPLETMFYGNFNQKALQVIRFVHDLAPELFKKSWDLQKKSQLSKLFVTLAGFNPFLSSPEDIEIYFKEAAETDPNIFLTLMENYDEYDATSWLHQVRVPTYILAGKLDLITPLANQKLIQQLVPNSKLEIIPNGSHCIQLDLPELINRKIENFLSNLEK